MTIKRKKAKKATGKFILLSSSCGGVAQLEGCGNNGFASIEAAKAAASKMLDDGDLYDPTVIVVAEIHDVAKPTGISWTGKTVLTD